MASRYRKLKLRDGSTIDEHRYIANAFDSGFDIIVHHIDGNKDNNSPDNLEIMSRTEHCALHGFGTTIRPTAIFAPSANNTGVCRHCGKEKAWECFPSDKNSTYGKRSTCKECVNAYKKQWRKRTGS
jgi:superfamily II helicase